MLIVNSRLQIPLSEFEFTYVRSSGPGGQNVNKVNSKALLRWPVIRSASLPPDVRERFLRRFASRLTTEGELLINSQRYRDQGRNADDCLEKLRRYGGRGRRPSGNTSQDPPDARFERKAIGEKT